MPKAVRDKLGLRPGTRVAFEVTANGALMRKGERGPAKAVDRVRGILKRERSTDVLISELRGPASALARKRR